MIYLPYDPGDYVGMLMSEPASGQLYRCVEVVREETTVCAEISADGAEAIIKLIAMAQRCGVRLDDEEIMSCMHIVAEHVGVPVMELQRHWDDLIDGATPDRPRKGR